MAGLLRARTCHLRGARPSRPHPDRARELRRAGAEHRRDGGRANAPSDRARTGAHTALRRPGELRHRWNSTPAIWRRQADRRSTATPRGVSSSGRCWRKSPCRWRSPSATIDCSSAITTSARRGRGAAAVHRDVGARRGGARDGTRRNEPARRRRTLLGRVSQSLDTSFGMALPIVAIATLMPERASELRPMLAAAAEPPGDRVNKALLALRCRRSPRRSQRARSQR